MVYEAILRAGADIRPSAELAKRLALPDRIPTLPAQRLVEPETIYTLPAEPERMPTPPTLPAEPERMSTLPAQRLAEPERMPTLPTPPAEPERMPTPPLRPLWRDPVPLTIIYSWDPLSIQWTYEKPLPPPLYYKKQESEKPVASFYSRDMEDELAFTLNLALYQAD
ncbi:hypothetical protein TNIN_393081 [Trichonephila inaurata madagascariensis]|uniref:Uncharacterized protein n=1 Tax=Trichonephila inaurata madagascariensis TaxID=2747483 RepID=A0A8X7CNB9_9ARAC|nr:hypothetical protein TNIN_393081 [Trichonephila inaurata madagascariensis]